MNRSNIITSLKEIKQELKEKYQILRIGLFGSYSKGTATEASDLDIIFELDENATMGLREIHDLEQFFKELFKIEKIDLVNQKYINPIIEDEIKNTVIYV